MNKIKFTKKEFQRTINEVVIVEGKTDTQKLQKLFNVKTIETNGSALNKQTINLIKQAATKYGVILFFDPDYQGNKIRKEVAKHLDVYKECFIQQKDIKPNMKKFGVAEASDEAIINAFENHVTNFSNYKESLSWIDYLNFNLDTKEKRLKVCNYLNISYANHKQLFKKLNLLGIDSDKLGSILEHEQQ